MRSDPIADMLTRIRNASRAEHEKVDIPASRLKVRVAEILKDEGFIKNFRLLEDATQGTLRVYLKYGVDTRTSPEIILSFAPPYLRYTRSVPCVASSSSRKFLMKPSSFRISATRTLSLDAGMSTFSCSARLALRMRVSMSAIGSLRMGLPARLHDAGHLALERQLAEAQTTHLELPEIAAWAAAA